MNATFGDTSKSILCSIGLIADKYKGKWNLSSLHSIWLVCGEKVARKFAPDIPVRRGRSLSALSLSLLFIKHLYKTYWRNTIGDRRRFDVRRMTNDGGWK